MVSTRAVVIKNGSPYAIVAGNPAKEIGKRFSDEEISMLLDLQ